MTRYLKALGLAMMAAFAFSALSAASASAQEGQLTSDSTEVTLTAKHSGSPNALTAFGSEVQCHGATYTGHKVDVTPHERLHSGETEVTITPEYAAHEPCTNNRVVHMNGCDYEFYDFTTTGEAAGTYGFDIDVVCPTGNEITVTGGACVVHIPPQTGLTGLHATNKEGKIAIKGTVTGITANLPCLGSTTHNAELHQDIIVEGHDEVGDPTNISISDA